MGEKSTSSHQCRRSPCCKRANLKPEQVEAIDRLYENNETLLIARLGFGKAIVALTAAQADDKRRPCTQDTGTGTAARLHPDLGH